MVTTKFVHQSIGRPGTGQEINRMGTYVKCASNVILYKTLQPCSLYVPSTMEIHVPSPLKSEGIKFRSNGHDS